MKKLPVLTIFSFLFLLAACTSKKETAGPLLTIKKSWLDSIAKNSDSIYSKPYRRADFVTAKYFISHKDSSETQLMYDSAGQVRQVIAMKNDRRTYFAQYYANGQLMADLKVDPFGQYDGPAVYYDERGNKISEGSYRHGLSSGEWKEYDKKGKAFIVKYDSNGARSN